MPELPEVETIRRDLEPLVAGRTITAAHVDPDTIELLAGLPIDALRAMLVGRVVTRAGRRGKYLLFGLDDGATWAVHLRMTGRLVWRDSDAEPETFERAKVTFDNGHDLRWSDLRKFGTWRIAQDPGDATPKLGPEPIAADWTRAYLRRLLKGRKAPVKAVLLDQRHVAGLGNIYVDEALFGARVRPDTIAGDVSPSKVKLLHEQCRIVLERGIENRGASFSDYVDGKGEQGSQQMHVKVFRRHGKPCYTCGSEIQRSVVGGRGTHFCPRCQPRSRKRTR
jgi:formamidopyrimidine-DNA glycosylase